MHASNSSIEWKLWMKYEKQNVPHCFEFIIGRSRETFHSLLFPFANSFAWLFPIIFNEECETFMSSLSSFWWFKWSIIHMNSFHFHWISLYSELSVFVIKIYWTIIVWVIFKCYCRSYNGWNWLNLSNRMNIPSNEMYIELDGTFSETQKHERVKLSISWNYRIKVTER